MDGLGSTLSLISHLSQTLFSKICPMQIVTLSCPVVRVLKHKVKEIYGQCNTPVITLDSLSLSPALFIIPIQSDDSVFPQYLILIFFLSTNSNHLVLI